MLLTCGSQQKRLTTTYKQDHLIRMILDRDQPSNMPEISLALTNACASIGFLPGI